MVTYSSGVDDVFRALADPTRRAVLDALFERDGQSVQALCERFPAMTRFGVMKHLDVLERANLVTTRREGRTKLHFLNPVPIQQIADRWIGRYAGAIASSMLDLKARLEAPASASLPRAAGRRRKATP